MEGEHREVMCNSSRWASVFICWNWQSVMLITWNFSWSVILVMTNFQCTHPNKRAIVSAL